MSNNNPLISIIVPCYNQAHFLSEAIESVVQQAWPNKEIIVVDDGSTDNTAAVAKQYTTVKYIYQHNQGLSAARNTGIKAAKGDYFVFLDSDDWLLPDALATNAAILQHQPELAFVSGGYIQYFVEWNKKEPKQNLAGKDHYLRLLERNYISMHATVMYQKWVFDSFLFDTTLQACEDYDFYLSIARHHPVHHHQALIAVYRIYSTSMSGNVHRMLSAALCVMQKHRTNCKTTEETAAWHRGVNSWKLYYSIVLYNQVLTRMAKHGRLAQAAETNILFKNNKYIFSKLAAKTGIHIMKNLIKKIIPTPGKRMLHRMGIAKGFTPSSGKVAAGDLQRLHPLSTAFGYDRGGPVDRYYIELFLKNNSHRIKGRVLEIGDDSYSRQFGNSQITQQDILHVDASNEMATIIGDLASAPQIADNSFDCIVLTQTLHLIYDFKAAIETCYRILKPGGCLLLTSPGITPIDHTTWKETWYWSFTDTAIRRLLNEKFPAEKTEISTFGNVYIATAFLYGMGMPDVKQHELDHNDPHFQVIITAVAEK